MKCCVQLKHYTQAALFAQLCDDVDLNNVVFKHLQVNILGLPRVIIRSALDHHEVTMG